MPDPLAAIEAVRTAGVAAVNQACDAAVNIVVGSTTFDLSDQLEKSTSGVILYAAAKYIQSRSFALRAFRNWKLIGNGATIHYTGPQDPRWAFDWQGACDTTAISDLTFINDGAPANGDKGITLFHPGGSNIKINAVHAVGFCDNWNGEQHPTNVTIDDFSNANASGFLIYGGGQRHTYHKLHSPNSTRESTLRLVGLTDFLIEDAYLWNEDRRELGDSLDSAKGAVRVEDGCANGILRRINAGLYADHRAANPTLTGGAVISVGPLSSADEPVANKGLRTTNIRLEQSSIFGTISINPGALQTAIANNDLHWNAAMSAAFIVSGYVAAYDRTVDGLTIQNNLVLSDTKRAVFLQQFIDAGKWQTGTRNVIVAGNGLVCPGWTLDESYSWSMIARAGERGPFAFKGNHWPVPAWGYVSNPREVAVFGTESRNPEQWAAETGDTFAPTDEAELRAAGIGVRP
jgi:hypothetical protein